MTMGDTYVRVEREFDERGNIAVLRTYGADGEKIARKDGYDEIRQVFNDEPLVDVQVFDGLAMDFAKTVGAQFIVKGVRSVSDFEYEQWQADFNRRLGGIETILLYCEPELASVSSSAVRELAHFGVDVSPFLP